MRLETLFAGATVIDGTGGPAMQADVGVADGRIAYLGAALPPEQADEVVDLTGLVLAPGIIDIHTHSDLSLVADPAAESKVLQGVTTEVVGNCGFSPHPVSDHGRERLGSYIGGIGGQTVPITWTDIDSYAEVLAQHPPTINVVALVGHGALRIAALQDPDGAIDPQGLSDMQTMLQRCLEQGAAGMSTGLTTPPSALAEQSEIAALAAICARYDRMYATHARAVGDNEYGAIDEAIDTAKRTGVRLEYSHLALNNPAHWGRAADSLRRFDSALADGVDVAFDVYPYAASSSGALQYLPYWVQAGGIKGMRNNAADPEWRRRALAEIAVGWLGGIPWHWDRIVLSAGHGYQAEVGLSFDVIADRWGMPPEQVLLDVCLQLGASAQVVLHYRTEQDMQAFLAHPLSIVGSDGLAMPLAPGGDHPHPRSYGTFPRVLGRYVRELGLFDLPSAIHKMTQAPARRLKITDRGVIAEGLVADLVAFDPATVADRATFARPKLPPVGVHRTVVAGTTVALDGDVMPHRPGTLIRCGQ